MIKEHFVNDEAKTLLEIAGFPFSSLDRVGRRGNWCTAEMAMAWLREKNMLIVIIPVPEDGKRIKWAYDVMYECKPFAIDRYEDKECVWYNTYEEALDAAIIFCLNHLS